MSQQVTTIVFVLGLVLILAFVVIGLSSPALRRRLQEPADRMVDEDRQRWGRPAAGVPNRKKEEKEEGKER